MLEIRLTSEDTMHGFHIVANINLIPKRGRGVASATFQPTPAATSSSA
jgi:hypothetical protein